MKYYKKLNQKNGEIKKVLSEEEEPKEIPYTIYIDDLIGDVEGTVDMTYSYNKYSIYIYNEIERPKEYTDVFHLIRNARSVDKIEIYINSPGGDMDTVCSFSSCFEECMAEVTTIVDGNADSAAFVLLCMGDVLRISEMSSMLAHNVRISTNLGTLNNVNSYINSSKQMYNRLLKKYCSKILSEQEIHDIIHNDAEIQLSSEEVINRLKETEKKLNAEIEGNNGSTV